MAQRGDLRIVLREGSRHAVLMHARIRGGGIYHGRKLVWGKRPFRQSHGAAAQKRLRAPSDKLRLAATGCELDSLDWTYRPKADNGSRFTKIVGLGEIAPYPGLTSELWAFDPAGTDMIAEHLREHYDPGGRVLAHVLADWTRPTLLALLWSLEPSAWEPMVRGSPGSAGLPGPAPL